MFGMKRDIIGLFGTCGNTTWRKDIAIPIIEKAGKKYFNPQRDDWRIKELADSMIGSYEAKGDFRDVNRLERELFEHSKERVRASIAMSRAEFYTEFRFGR